MNLHSIFISRFIPSLLVMFLTISGCTTVQTYSGAKLAPDKIAKIKGATNFYVISFVSGHILKVDGQKVSGDEIELIPGSHEIVAYLMFIGGGTSASGIPQTFTFIAEAGHTYKVDGNWNTRDNQIWIFDEQTKKIVAGEKP